MSERSYLERVEDVLDAMGLRTFASPMTLDYRFGSLEAEEEFFRCFVREEDVELMFTYLEIRGDEVFWVALENPGLDATMEAIKRIALKCRKTLGRHHVATFVLASEEGVGEEKESLLRTFNELCKACVPGVYYRLLIWDQEGLKQAETELQQGTKNKPVE